MILQGAVSGEEGLGIETKFKIGGESTKVVTFGDGDVEPAFGLFEGKRATLNKIELQYPDAKVYKTTSKDLVEDVLEGTILFQQAGGGGGYGNPYFRHPVQVAQEVKNRIISIEQAKEDYGVIIDPETFDINLLETEKLRKKKK